MNPILKISGITIRRGPVVILDQLSWEIRPGEHWVILGPNGCGKTSLLSALTGYFTPTEGSIEVLGLEFGASDWRELRKGIGLVSSSVRQLMHDEDCALEIVAGGMEAQIGHWGSIPASLRAAAEQALERSEAGHLGLRTWHVLSQGERQRVLIARALISQPRLLILDEPCAGLDPVAREHFLAGVQRLGSDADAPSMVLVTHHVEEITPQFTHVLLLRAGRIVAAGPAAETLTSTQLRATFDAPVRLSRRGHRYSLTLGEASA